MSFFFLLIALLLAACGKGKKDLHDFYFPLKQLKEESKIYEYKLTMGDTSLTLYWHYQTTTQKDTTCLVGDCYDSGFHPLMLMREEQVVNGMKLKELVYYGTDNEGKSAKTKAVIEGGAVFPFEVTDDKSVFVNVIKYADPKDSTHTTTLTRNRRFLKDGNFDFNGKKLPTAEFEMKEELSEHDNKRGGWLHVYNVQESYAKGIGLVCTKRAIDGGATFETRLVGIYTMKELEDKFTQNLKKNNE